MKWGNCSFFSCIYFDKTNQFFIGLKNVETDKFFRIQIPKTYVLYCGSFSIFSPLFFKSLPYSLLFKLILHWSYFYTFYKFRCIVTSRRRRLVWGRFRCIVTNRRRKLVWWRFKCIVMSRRIRLIEWMLDRSG